MLFCVATVFIGNFTFFPTKIEIFIVATVLITNILKKISFVHKKVYLFVLIILCSLQYTQLDFYLMTKLKNQGRGDGGIMEYGVNMEFISSGCGIRAIPLGCQLNYRC